jgi:Fe-Mn family superoxide dismutase
LIRRDFGSVETWRADLKATGMGGRGWAWTAYDWDERRLFNHIGDAQNTFPVWNATPLVALDVYEHAYFLDYQTDRGSYIDAFFNNLDWGVVNGWVEAYGIPVR